VGELKTRPTDADVAAFLAAIPDPGRRADCQALAAMMAEVTGQHPVLWGTAIVGFGRFDYRRADGEGFEWFPVGFASRKSDLTVYLGLGLGPLHELATRLGKHKAGKGCLYLKRLSDVDQGVLREMVAAAYARPMGDLTRD
jgi:hypothetical protein